MRLTIVTPVYNDWDCLLRFLDELEALDFGPDLSLQVLAVNDGSALPAPAFSELGSFDGIERFEIAHLVRNLGHQRAIAVGLVAVSQHFDSDLVVVMDADGEDRPEDVVRFVEAYHQHPDHIILARRAKRSEGRRFAFFYQLYKVIFELLTGERIDFGNYSLIPASMLEQFVYNGDIWNHLAATIVKTRLPVVKIDTVRGKRYTGQTKMKLTALVLHGLSAVSVYSDIVFVRLIIASCLIIGLSLASIGVVVLIKLFTDLAIPGWATTAVGLLLLLAFQAIAFTSSLAFMVLNARSQPFLIPAIQAPMLVKSRQTIHNHAPVDIPR